MELADHLIDGLVAQENATGAKLTYAGADYPCSGGAQFGGKHLSAGGFRMVADVSLAVRLAVFPNGAGIPQENQKCKYTPAEGAPPQDLLIKSVTTIFNAVLVIECQDPRTGA